MSNKAQALAVLHDHQISTVEISTIGEICRKHLEEIRRVEKMTAQRAIVLGITLWKVRLALPHGKWTPWQEEHLSSGKSYVNYFMRLALVFLMKSRATKVELRALPSDSVELSAGDEISRALLGRLEKFVGDCSLHELLVKHGLKGVARDAGDDQADADATTAGGEQMLFTEVCDHFFSLRRTLCTRETLLRLQPDQLDAAKRELGEIVSSFNALYAEARGAKTS
jgi:hypothetical protein